MRVAPLLLLVGCQPAHRAPDPDWVADAAAVLSAAEESELVDMLLTLNDNTAVELTCVTVHGTADQPISVYADDLLQRWEVGLSGVFNGLAIVVDTKERQVHLSRGVGMRWVLADDDVHVIIEAMTIHLKDDEYFQGLRAGIEEIVRRVEGVSWNVAYYDLMSLPSEGAEGAIVSFTGTVQRVSGDTVFVMDEDSVLASVLLLPGTTPMVTEELWYVHARVKTRKPLEVQLLGLEAGEAVADIF